MLCSVPNVWAVPTAGGEGVLAQPGGGDPQRESGGAGA